MAKNEYDQLQRSGYAGEGFFSKGQRLGVGVSHDLPPHKARLKAVEAAEKRKSMFKVLGSGGDGRRLGGRTAVNGLSARELAAQAAEWRARDEKICGQGVLADIEATKAAQDSVEDNVIDLTLEPEEIIMDKFVEGISKKSNSTHTTSKRQTIRSGLQTDTSHAVAGNPTGWVCPTCTLVNELGRLQCAACLSNGPLPTDPTSGWVCHICQESGVPYERWSCPFCGTIKLTS